MCRLHHKACASHKRGCRVGQDIYEQVGFNCINHCKIQVATFLGRNFVREIEHRCADFDTRGRRGKAQGRPTAETSRKN